MARQRRPEAVAVLAVCLLVAVPAVAAAVATAAAGVSPLPPAVVWRQLPAGARGSGAYPLGRQGVPVVTPTPPPGNAAAAAAAARGCVGLFASTGSGNAQASSGESAPYLCAITATVTTAADITSCGVVVSEELTWPWTTGRPAVRVVDYRDVEGVSVTALTFTPDGVEQLSVRRLAPSTSRRCGNQTAVSWPTVRRATPTTFVLSYTTRGGVASEPTGCAAAGAVSVGAGGTRTGQATTGWTPGGGWTKTLYRVSATVQLPPGVSPSGVVAAAPSGLAVSVGGAPSVTSVSWPAESIAPGIGTARRYRAWWQRPVVTTAGGGGGAAQCATRACDYRYVACREGDDDDGDPWYKNLPEWLIPAAIVLTLVTVGFSVAAARACGCCPGCKRIDNDGGGGDG